MSDALAVVQYFPGVRVANDTARWFRISIYNETTGEAVDFGGATATFKLVTFDRTTVIVNEGACLIEGPLITYQPVLADVSTPGHYLGRFKVTTTDGVLLLGHFHYEIASDL
jgi:hypothetical protein